MVTPNAQMTRMEIKRFLLLAIAVSYTHLDVYKRQIEFFDIHICLLIVFGSECFVAATQMCLPM